jgi:DNA-binding response OmpR family regulator
VDERAALEQLSAELADFDRRLIGRNRVLIVDDEPVVRQILHAVLDAPDLDIVEAATAGEAVRALAVSPYNLLLTDKNLPDQSGVELMRLARDAYPQLEVILMTAYPSVETALSCIDLGAYDYLLKPFDDITVVAGRVRAALARQNRSYRAAKLVEKLRLGLTVTLGALPKDRQLTEVGRLQGALRAFENRAPIAECEVVVAGEGSISGEARAIGCHVRVALSPAELQTALSPATNLLVLAELGDGLDAAR